MIRIELNGQCLDRVLTVACFHLLTHTMQKSNILKKFLTGEDMVKTCLDHLRTSCVFAGPYLDHVLPKIYDFDEENQDFLKYQKACLDHVLTCIQYVLR